MATEVAVETQQNWIGGKWVPQAVAYGDKVEALQN